MSYPYNIACHQLQSKTRHWTLRFWLQSGVMVYVYRLILEFYEWTHWHGITRTFSMSFGFPVQKEKEKTSLTLLKWGIEKQNIIYTQCKSSPCTRTLYCGLVFCMSSPWTKATLLFCRWLIFLIYFLFYKGK